MNAQIIAVNVTISLNVNLNIVPWGILYVKSDVSDFYEHSNQKNVQFEQNGI